MQEKIGLFLSRFKKLKNEANNSPKTLSWLATQREDIEDLCYELKCNYDAIAQMLSRKGFKHTFITVAFENEYKEYEGNYHSIVSRIAELAEDRTRLAFERILWEEEKNWIKAGKTKEDFWENLNTNLRNLNINLPRFIEGPFDPIKDDPSALIEGILDDANLLDVSMSDIDEEWAERYEKAWGAWRFFKDKLGLDFSGINKRWLKAPEIFLLPHVAQGENSPIVQLYNEAVKAYAFGCKNSSVAICRSLMEHILKTNYKITGGSLIAIIILAEKRFPQLKKLSMQTKRKLANNMLHNYEGGQDLEDRAVIDYLRTIKYLLQYDYCLCSDGYGIMGLNSWLNGAKRCNRKPSA